MSGVTLDYSDVIGVRQKIQRAIRGVPNEVKKTNRAWVPRLRARLIQHSSGRPGPNIITGAYNAAYVVETTDGDLGVEAGNSSPQSDRLENGFVDQDSMGRQYHQPPFAHFRPTLEEVSPEYAEDILASFWRWW